jgi:peptidyl-prolyl cis-trans isomerase B (cyclophilin B)
MARTSNPHSATAQFFINVNDNKSLNFKSKDRNGWGYCVFGKVIEGMEIIDRIKNVKTSAKNGHGDVPIEAVIIEKITLIDEIYKRSVCKFAVLNLLIVLIGRDLS